MQIRKRRLRGQLKDDVACVIASARISGLREAGKMGELMTNAQPHAPSDQWRNEGIFKLTQAILARADELEKEAPDV